MKTPPITMATQHPDNAGVPWWRGDAFIPTQDEIDELTILFSELPIDEYMWDWEGKYVDESVGEKLFARTGKLLTKRKLGEDIHLTYRIPAFDGDKMHRMARAFMNVLSLADLGKDIGLKRPPVVEMFLPLTTSAKQPMKVRSTFKKIEQYHRAVFHPEKKSSDILKYFEVTPLVEDVPSLLGIEKIVRPYWTSLLKERSGTKSQRVFLARSDPALNAGLVPAVLAVKAALSTVHAVGDDLGIKIYPIIGTGSLPFRGSVNPTYTDVFLPQYAGVHTYSIQSAFRYDYPKAQVKKALEEIQKRAPKLKVVDVTAKDRKAIQELCGIFSNIWKPTIEAIAPLINQVAAFVPPRRERMQHIGLFGYSRGVGKVRLPRAIGFTAALYSVGIPPELISTGRGLVAAEKKGLLWAIEKFYPALRDDLIHAGKYFNEENLALLAKKSNTWKLVQEDVRSIEKILGISLRPVQPHHLVHRNLTSTIFQSLSAGPQSSTEVQVALVEAGKIRRSLG